VPGQKKGSDIYTQHVGLLNFINELLFADPLTIVRKNNEEMFCFKKHAQSLLH
jgi:hypothetical protein